MFKEKKLKDLINKKPLTLQNIHQQKLKSIKEQLKQHSANEEATNEFDKNTLGIVFKIAHELLESMKVKQEPSDKSDDSNTSETRSQLEFFSSTAEMLLKENDINATNKAGMELESEKEAEEKKMQFKILNGGNNDINYKKALDYLGSVMKFKINYQSLLGVLKTFETFFKINGYY